VEDLVHQRESNLMKVVMITRHAVLAALASSLLSGCSYLESLKNVGEQPPLSAVDNPTTRPGYKPVQMPMPAAQPAAYNPNSLWRSGSRAFFKDQRAHQIGDILTVKVNITDKANIDNETKAQSRNDGGFRHPQFLRQTKSSDYEHAGANAYLHGRFQHDHGWQRLG
jgi:flagellar L-ring protein precursor FlgH